MRQRAAYAAMGSWLVVAAMTASAQSVQVLGSGEDARRCSMAAELAASLRNASREDLADCERALELGALRLSDRAGTLVNKGIVETALDDPAAAMRSYEAASRLLPELPEAWVGRGNVLFLGGDTAAAISAYDRALELGIGRRHVALLNRAMAYEARADLERAEQDYRAALEIVPDWPPARVRLDRVLRKRAAAASGAGSQDPPPSLR